METMILVQILILLPILIIGGSVIIIMLSIAYRRHQFMHAILTGISLSLSVLSVGIVKNQIFQIPYTQSLFQLIHVDSFSILSMFLVLISSLSSTILSYNWLFHYPGNRDEFYLLLLISSIGGLSLVMTNHLAILFLGMEIMSLPLFGLISYSFFQRFSLEAGIKYIILSGVSSAFFLLGIALIYVDTGYLSFDDIKQVVCNHHYSITSCSSVCSILIIIGVGLMMVGFGFKLSFFPFHIWTPDVYQGSPYPISMYLITSKIAIITVLIRFFSMFTDESYNEIFCIFLSVVSCCSMLFGSIMAIKQKDIKRILAYSSITNIGYILIAIIALRTDCMSLETIGLYLINYLIAHIGIFSIISIVSTMYDNNHINNRDISLLILYRGLFWRKPVLSILLTIIILSLAGIPMTLGFIGKFYLFILGIHNQLWLLIMFLLISSVVSMFYYLKIMISLYQKPINNMFFNSSVVINNWAITPSGVMVIFIVFLILLLGLYPQIMFNNMHLHITL